MSLDCIADEIVIVDAFSNDLTEEIRHSHWYPDRQLRLFKTDCGSWGELNLNKKTFSAGLSYKAWTICIRTYYYFRNIY